MTLGTSATQAEAIQSAYNSSHQELEDLRDAALKACQSVEEGDAQAGAPWRAASVPWAVMSPVECEVRSA
jgi:predicted lipoprotein